MPAVWRSGAVGLLLCLLCGSLVALVAGPARAQEAAPAQQREEVRRRQADVAAQLDTLRATDAQVTDALSVLQANVAAQQARVDDARRSLDAATTAVARAQQREDQANVELDVLTSRLQSFAIDSYIRPPQSDVTDAIVTGQPLQAPERQAMARFRIRDLDDVADQVRAQRQDLERARREADDARAAAERSTADEAARLADLQEATRQQQRFAGDVAARIDRALSEAANLASQDAQLSQQISEQQARLASLLARTGALSGASGGSRPAGAVSLTIVGGIEVEVSVAANLGAMLAAAAGDGIALSGGGYRDQARQIALRRQNCGADDHAIWDKPSGECSPPTARPGASLHELGLAIDFSANGGLIRSHADPGYQWLAAHAAQYGFVNLPSEPWHWSVNGS